jgi:hypothetical protein
MAKRIISKLPEYQKWYSNQSFKKLSNTQTQKIDEEIKSKIHNEFNLFKNMDVNEYTLWHKYREIKDWLPSQNQGEIQRVKRQIWKPKGLSDFRRIEPELVYVRPEYEIQKINIWGEKKVSALKNDEPFQLHWQIIRTLVSSARNDGVIGRSLRFLVRDKKTKTYLGVICISSEMPLIKARNDAIGWDINKHFSAGGKIENLANGQTIVPTQPFGTAFLGGKLLALLCLSDVVANTWEEMYGKKLVGVGTTSLYGDKEGGSQYDNLSPYWTTLDGYTSGKTPYKLSDEFFFPMREWMRIRYPEQYWTHFEEKKPDGQLKLRDNKNKAMTFCYRKLGFKPDAYNSGHQRGAHFSRLYKNTDEYLRDEIDESELVPSFDNSIEALTQFWRFGSMGDTTRPSQEMFNNVKPKRLAQKIEMKGQVKGRIDAKSKRAKENNFENQIPLKGRVVDWYEDLSTMTWDETKKKFGKQVGR